jgi:DNA-binding CsgD family transcriptional regulator
MSTITPPAAPPAGSPGSRDGDDSSGRSLEIHVNPQNEEELESLLDTVTALMWRRDREHRPRPGGMASSVWPPEVSAREVEILQLLADGATAASIALRLHLSVHTVRWHIRNVRRKLKSATISQAVAIGIMLALVTPTTPAAADAALDCIEHSLLLDD